MCDARLPFSFLWKRVRLLLNALPGPRRGPNYVVTIETSLLNPLPIRSPLRLLWSALSVSRPLLVIGPLLQRLRVSISTTPSVWTNGRLVQTGVRIVVLRLLQDRCRQIKTGMMQCLLHHTCASISAVIPRVSHPITQSTRFQLNLDQVRIMRSTVTSGSFEHNYYNALYQSMLDVL
jgi:hypothetical protein